MGTLHTSTCSNSHWDLNQPQDGDVIQTNRKQRWFRKNLTVSASCTIPFLLRRNTLGFCKREKHLIMGSTSDIVFNITSTSGTTMSDTVESTGWTRSVLSVLTCDIIHCGITLFQEKKKWGVQVFKIVPFVACSPITWFNRCFTAIHSGEHRSRNSLSLCKWVSRQSSHLLRDWKKC